MSLFDQLMSMTEQEKMFSGMSDELLNKLNNLADDCGISIDDVSLEFKDPEFLDIFFRIFPFEEQKRYLITNYNYEHNMEYDLNYLLVFRRAIYTEYPKNENFWSTEFNQARFGLKNEQPIGSPMRLYSSIMVSTMGKLINHGLADLDHGGVTDGEVVIDDSKNFDDFLFVYKPEEERKLLEQYISSGGISYEELVTSLNESSEERKAIQGFKK